MKTLERMNLLCQCGQAPELLGSFTLENLKQWLTLELGDAEALDRFIHYGDISSKAYAPKHLLHIVSGNTPHAAIQSLMRGLLLGSHNFVKLPSSPLPELARWIDQLPAKLQSLIELHHKASDQLIDQADAIIVIGSDQTIEKIRQRSLPHQRFISHGHKVSIAVIHDDFERAAPLAAKDISLYNQRGCLSPHAIYVKETANGQAKKFAALLAESMQDFCQAYPPEPLNLSEAGSVRNLREVSRFTSANSDIIQLWESSERLDWTIIYDENPTLRLSCLNRCVFVKPLPDTLDLCSLGGEALHLSSIALHPFDLTEAESLCQLPAHRICRLGQSQEPSLFWHHDELAPLASLVTWKDIG